MTFAVAGVYVVEIIMEDRMLARTDEKLDIAKFERAHAGE